MATKIQLLRGEKHVEEENVVNLDKVLKIRELYVQS